MNAKAVTLIISTYNRPSALSLVLQSIHSQEILPDEIIIADDGSTIETKILIKQFSQKSHVLIQHVWQKDLGFRLAQSRNNALRISKGNYVIFIDGDTILHPQFIKDHLQHKETNTFVVGSRVLLDPQTTKTIIHHQAFSFNCLTTKAANKINAIHNNFLSRITSKKRNQPIEKLIFKIRGCNLACHLSDILSINGFNEDFSGWGREDSEFALRLLKKGLWLKHIKFNAIQYHLYHHENSKNNLGRNHALLQQAQKSHSFQCTRGIKILNPNE